MNDELDSMGPVDYLVVEFPQARVTGEAMARLIDLVDLGIVRILDLLFLRKDTDGSVVAIEVADLDSDGTLDLRVLEGASSGLMGNEEIAEAAAVIEPGSAAGILVYENLWAAPFATALRRAGAQWVAGGRIPIPALVAALEATEPAGA